MTGILKIASASRKPVMPLTFIMSGPFADGGAIVRFRFPGSSKNESLQVVLSRSRDPRDHAGHLCYTVLSAKASR